MTWTKKSDDFADDCWGLSDAAYRLHDEGLIWSNKKLLDCRIPKDDLRRFKRPEAIGELLESGWWAEEADVYVIRHHAGYQRLREDVLAQQAANLTNGRKGGRPRKHPQPEPVSDSRTHTKTGSVSTTQSVSEPVRERASQAQTERDRDLFSSSEGSISVGGSGGKRAKADPPLFEEFWTAWPRKVAKTEARKKFAAVVSQGADPAVIVEAAKAHAEQWQRDNKEVQFIPHAATWLNQGRYEDVVERRDLRLVSNSDSPWGTWKGPESPWAQGWG